MRTLIIAEAGVNHNGSLDLARKLIDVAAEAGADYVKFQTYKTSSLVSENAVKAEYQKRNIVGKDDTQYNMLKTLELTPEMHYELVSYCQQKGIAFLSTAFDSESIELLDELNIDFFKISSGEITNKPYLVQIAEKNRPVVVSTGMANLREVKETLDVLIEGGLTKEKITVLHANTEYPTPMEDVNLRAMLSIEKAFNVAVGYSDHTLGIEIPIAAVAMGAKVIEKHFTLDRSMEGPDHKASLEPQELEQMIKAIRNIEKALGNGIKNPSPSEEKNMAIARKSIVAKKEIKKGEFLTKENLTIKRPGSGINPMRWNEVLGQIAKRDFLDDELIEL